MAIVTLSRQLGSGAEEIAKTLVHRISYAYVDKEKLFEDIRKKGTEWSSWENEMDEVCPTLWEQFDRSFSGLVALVEESIMEAALADNVVIMGRGSNWLLKDVPHALHIRIVAPMDLRIERLMKREKFSREAALHLIKKSDHDRSCYAHTVYERDWSNPEDFDIVFDTGKLSSEEIIGLIIAMLPSKDRLFTDAAKEKLRREAVAARIKARITTNPDVYVPTLEVFDSGDAFVIRGVVRNVRDHTLVEAVAQKAAGLEKIKCELHYRL